MGPGYCHRQAAVGFALYCYGQNRANKHLLQYPPREQSEEKTLFLEKMMSTSSLIWGSKTICGTICSVGVDKSSGWDLADARMPPVWTRTKHSRTMWGATTLWWPAPRDVAGWFSQQSPGWKPDHRDKNIFVPVSFCFSCFLVVVLHYEFLVKSFVLHCLTCRRGCVGRRIRAFFVNFELSVPGTCTARQHIEIII